jgi:uncharacterized cysteine cluster protein YcgN (CxxCxxCC family)
MQTLNPQRIRIAQLPTRRRENKNCIRCGECCYIRDPETGNKIKACPQLEYIDKKARCKVYKKRLGTILGTHKGKVYACVPLEWSDYKARCPTWNKN